MFILVPRQTYHEITDEKDDVVVSLVPLDIPSIQSIDADIETGNAIINYKSGGVVETLTPFVDIAAVVFNSNLISFIDGNVTKYSEPVKRFLNQTVK